MEWINRLLIIIIVITKIMTNVKRRAGSGHDCPWPQTGPLVFRFAAGVCRFAARCTNLRGSRLRDHCRSPPKDRDSAKSHCQSTCRSLSITHGRKPAHVLSELLFSFLCSFLYFLHFREKHGRPHRLARVLY